MGTHLNRVELRVVGLTNGSGDSRGSRVARVDRQNGRHLLVVGRVVEFVGEGAARVDTDIDSFVELDRLRVPQFVVVRVLLPLGCCEHRVAADVFDFDSKEILENGRGRGSNLCECALHLQLQQLRSQVVGSL